MRFLALAAAVFFTLMSSGVYAAPSALPVSAPAVDIQKVGVVAAVTGSVTIENKGLAGRIAQSGESVYIGDTVSTNSKSTLQILLLDETVFTIGPDSAIVIDTFIYDPATQSGQINAQVVKGAFRFVTGKIARKKPSNMKVDLPTGSIGVRGTIVAGRSEGSRSTVVLLGPGSQNNTNSRIGEITLNNEVNGQNRQVTVTRPGYGSVIEGPGASPLPAFEIPAAELDSLISSLGTQSSGDGSEDQDGGSGSGTSGGDPTAQAGQDTAAGGDSADTFGETGDLLKTLGSESENAAQSSTADGVVNIKDGVASFADLFSVPSGKFHYSDTGVPLLEVNINNGRTYSFDMDIDFQSRTVGGTGAQNRIDAQIPGSPSDNVQYTLTQKSFGDAADSAVFTFSESQSGGTCSACGIATIKVTLQNSGGNAGAFASHSIDFDNNLVATSGSGVSDERTAA